MHWLEIRQNPQENTTNRNTEAVTQGQWTDCALEDQRRCLRHSHVSCKCTEHESDYISCGAG